MSESFASKYRPKTLDEVQGHPSAINDIKKWAENWSRGSEPILLHGPAGTGKTSTAEALTNDMEWGYVEINASEERSKGQMDVVIQQIRSESANRRLFLFDEVDSIDGRSLRSLYEALEDAPNPVICTANEKWKVPDGLENRCRVHKFTLQDRSIKSFLRDVADEEDIDISSRELGQLATRNGMRDALNDLQEYSKSGKTDWDARDTDDSPFAVISRILKNENYIGDMTPDDMVAFLNENVKNEFDGVEAMRAYQAIAEADKWLGLVNRTQDYSWWRYASPIAQEVSNLRLTEPYGDWVNVDYPKSRRNYTPRATSDSKEATLYKEIKGEQGYVASFDFHEFRKIVLPELQNLPDEDKKQIALSHSLSDSAMKAFDLRPSDFDDWEMQEQEVEDTAKDTEISDYISNDESDNVEKSIFNY